MEGEDSSVNSRTVAGLILVLIGLVGMVSLVALYSSSYYGNRYGGMGPWMMGQGTGGYPSGQTIVLTMDQAESIAKHYLDSSNNPDLAIKEIMEFQNNFYIIFYERSTGVGAFEMLIWKTNPSSMMGYGDGYGGMMGGGMMVGQIMPEPGPNMMWNTKYGGMMGQMGGGMMGGGMMGGQQRGAPTANMPISEDEAKKVGQQYLDRYFPGSTIEGVTKFYGYYTFDFEKDGKIQGMFSVNGYTGQTWYHGWHGMFIGEKEF
jgi:hypothetical protein